MDVRELSHWSIYQHRREVVWMSTTGPVHERRCHYVREFLVEVLECNSETRRSHLMRRIWWRQPVCGRSIRIAQFADDWSYHACWESPRRFFCGDWRGRTVEVTRNFDRCAWEHCAHRSSWEGERLKAHHAACSTNECTSRDVGRTLRNNET